MQRILLFIIVGVLFSCSKEKQPDIGSSLSIKVDGVLKETTDVLAVVVTTHNNELTINGYFGDNELVSFGVNNPTLATYSGYFTTNPAFFGYKNGPNLSQDSYGGYTGTLSILSINRDRISGTFEFSAGNVDRKKILTEGKFDARLYYDRDYSRFLNHR